MCCACDGSGLGLRNTYWFPKQWDRALRRARVEAERSGVRHRVYKQEFANGNWGWKVAPL